MSSKSYSDVHFGDASRHGDTRRKYQTAPAQHRKPGPAPAPAPLTRDEVELVRLVMRAQTGGYNRRVRRTIRDLRTTGHQALARKLQQGLQNDQRVS